LRLGLADRVVAQVIRVSLRWASLIRIESYSIPETFISFTLRSLTCSVYAASLSLSSVIDHRDLAGPHLSQLCVKAILLPSHLTYETVMYSNAGHSSAWVRSFEPCPHVKAVLVNTFKLIPRSVHGTVTSISKSSERQTQINLLFEQVERPTSVIRRLFF